MKRGQTLGVSRLLPLLFLLFSCWFRGCPGITGEARCRGNQWYLGVAGGRPEEKGRHRREGDGEGLTRGGIAGRPVERHGLPSFARSWRGSRGPPFLFPSFRPPSLLLVSSCSSFSSPHSRFSNMELNKLRQLLQTAQKLH